HPYDYSNESLMVNINPGLVHKSSRPSTSASPPITSYEDNSQFTAYPAYAFESMPMGFTPVPNYHHSTMSRLGYYDENSVQPNSPESVSSSISTSSPPSTTLVVPNHSVVVSSTILAPQAIETELITPLVSPINNNNQKSPKIDNVNTARVKEMITRANSVPMEFYHTEFLEYSKETYEKKMESKRNKRKRPQSKQSKDEDDQENKRKKTFEYNIKEDSEEDMDEFDIEDNKQNDHSNMSSAEIRRQIHIQSEQKRRAQIKDGFDELRKHLPGCNNKKMSKAALLTRTVQQLQHLKGMQNELLSEVERLLQENETLKKFQHGVLQRQAMEKMYTF
ncbi:hypothetical protein CU098_013459, partial [Rhizopus stolonifer]